MLQIHDILVWMWIRIRGSMPVTNGSGSWIRILLFSSLTFMMPAKTKILTQFVQLISVLRIRDVSPGSGFLNCYLFYFEMLTKKI